jgi:hypothetical protein
VLSLLNSTFAALLFAAPAPVVDQPVESNSPTEGFVLPQLVRASNAFVLRMPVQLALVGYAPRVHLELGWMRALTGPHWIGVSGTARLDYARSARITGEGCEDACTKAGVYGGELAVSYRFVPRFHRKPWLAPQLHAALVGGSWTYASGHDFDRRLTVSLGARAGAGLRIFLTPRVGVGMDIDVQADLHLPGPGDPGGPEFGLGLALLPALLEIRG